MLQAAGYPETKGALSRVAAEVRTPARTISRWFNAEFNPPPDKTVSEKKVDFVQAIRNELQGILNEMPNARADAGYRELATAFGIMVDKLQLLSGEPTERSEHWMTVNADVLNAARRRRQESKSDGSS